MSRWSCLRTGTSYLLPGASLVPVAAAVLGPMLAYAGLIARAFRFKEPVTCSCFGALGRHTIDRTTMALNVVLSLLAAVVVAVLVVGGAPAAGTGATSDGEVPDCERAPVPTER